jgi:pyruvate kinase
MIRAGLDMVRLSLSHGPLAETQERICRVREAADAEGRIVGVLADLPGPKIRAAPFPEGGVFLAEGDRLELAPAAGDDTSGDHRIAVDHAAMLEDLRPGDAVVLGDGAISLLVEEAGAGRATAVVQTGGWAQGRPGVSPPPGRTRLSSPTPEDIELLESLSGEVDALAVSFVQTAADVNRARQAIPVGNPMVLAKIETQEAVDAIDEIIAAADGVMVARGDLGIRCALEDVPHYQKQIIRTGVAYGRPVITATQMLESMVRAPTPTRAEVSDVANAVFDGTSAVMLSAETAIGHDPVAAVRTMARIARRAEQDFDYHGWGRSLDRQLTTEASEAQGHDRITAAVSAAGWRAALDAEVTAIIACTNSGATARAISRFRPTMPVVAATPSIGTARQLSVAWGITPMVTDRHATTDEIVWFAVEAAVKRDVVRPGDVVAVLVGSPSDVDPATDTLRLVRVR